MQSKTQSNESIVKEEENIFILAKKVPTPPKTSQLNKMIEIINSLPEKRDKNSLIMTSWAATEAIPVAITNKIS